MFWMRFAACLLLGHRYRERGYGRSDGGPCDSTEVVCERCDLDFDPWDCEMIDGDGDNMAWRFRDLINRR